MPVPVNDIAKTIWKDRAFAEEVRKCEEDADKVSKFGEKVKQINGGKKPKEGYTMIAVLLAFMPAWWGKEADSPDDPLKMDLDEEAPSNSGGSSLMGVFESLKAFASSKNQDSLTEDEFQTTLDDAGANSDTSGILMKIYNGIRALRQRISHQASQISALQKDKNELNAKLVGAGKDLARETSRADKAGVELADLKAEKEKLEKQLKRSKASPAGPPQDTLTTEAEFQLSGCVLMVRTWLIKSVPVSWAETKDTRAIMLDGVLTAVSPMWAVVSLLESVVKDMIVKNLKSFMEDHPAEKEEIESIDPKLKAGAYAKLLNMTQHSQIALYPLYAMIKAVYTAAPGVEVSAKQVSTICKEKLLVISDMCVIPMPMDGKNGGNQYFPKTTEYQLIEAHLQLSGIAAVIKVAECYLHDSWKMRTDGKYIADLVANKKRKRDEQKERKENKRAKHSHDAAATAVNAEVDSTQIMLTALAGAGAETESGAKPGAEPGAEPGADSLIVLAAVSGQKRKCVDEGGGE
jgi:hypothetical protein